MARKNCEYTSCVERCIRSRKPGSPEMRYCINDCLEAFWDCVFENIGFPAPTGKRGEIDLKDMDINLKHAEIEMVLDFLATEKTGFTQKDHIDIFKASYQSRFDKYKKQYLLASS